MDYLGNSMKSTLKTGDFLMVVPYKDRKIRIGDVVVFRSPCEGTLIVHRIVSISKHGVRTKGDNSMAHDDWTLQPNQILGRVVAVRRGKKRIRISGGLLGRMYTITRGIGKRADTRISAILRPAYHWFARAGILTRFLSRRISTRVFCFKRGDTVELQLLWGKRIIGRILPGQQQWYIRRPFKLFVDEAFLPGNKTRDLISPPHNYFNTSRKQSRVVAKEPVKG